ncbi:hypothetical protein MTP99_008603 [Tenebrio molitor]|jgi:hypothetical protein|uniref:Uncharacterized protein n=1 Tax=Tenebrio molitor TaxID=7067 RepID=A0A8J6HQY1_TENMO|nr:hypothetical protein GEV33_004751 [Tenebrio molitor]KAJ3635715.1 hypothetical protein MTP99_008603 [Tenebrio molitor]CAH1367376.1 unnamed protein product [Tenebrio molitor]
MNSQFIDQVQILMHAQQIKCAESVFGKSNYMWLCSKRTPVIWMSTKDEFLIRQALTKVTPDQQVKVMKQLLTWLDNHPDAHSLKIPELSLQLLHHAANANIMSELTVSRMNSFRNSLRRLSLITNRIAPTIAAQADRPRRSVTFNDIPTVYRIKY